MVSGQAEVRPLQVDDFLDTHLGILPEMLSKIKKDGTISESDSNDFDGAITNVEGHLKKIMCLSNTYIWSEVTKPKDSGAEGGKAESGVTLKLSVRELFCLLSGGRGVVQGT